MIIIDQHKEQEIIHAIAAEIVSAKQKDSQLLAEDLFKVAWSFAYRNFLVDDLLICDPPPHICNWFYINFQLSVKEYFLLTIVIILQKLGFKKFGPRIVLDNNYRDYHELFKDDRCSVVVSTHNGFAFPGYLLSKNGKSVVTISSHSEVQKIFDRTGIAEKITVIENNLYSLAYLQERIRPGVVMSVAIDYSSETGKYIYISQGMLRFAELNGLKLYYAVSDVQDDGTVKVRFEVASDTSSLLEKIQAFIELTNLNRIVKKELSIKK